MKTLKLICVILSVLLTVSTLPITSAAEQDRGLNAEDMFVEDFELSNERTSELLYEYRYVPESHMNNNTLVFFVSITVCYTVPGNEIYPGVISPEISGYETSEELLDNFWKSFSIKKEYAEKYLNLDPVFLINDNIYYGVKYKLSFKSELLEETASFSPIKRAKFFAKFLEAACAEKLPDNFSIDKSYLIGAYYYDLIFRYDINYDGEVNTKDSLVFKKIMCGSSANYNAYAADSNGDGLINAKDGLTIKKQIATM